MSSPDDTTNFCPCCVELTRKNEALRAEVQALTEANRQLLADVKSCTRGDCSELQNLRAQVHALKRSLLDANITIKTALDRWPVKAPDEIVKNVDDSIELLLAELKEQADD